MLPDATSISRTRPVDIDCVAVTTASFTLNVAKVDAVTNPAEKGLTAVSEPPFIVNELGSVENAW